MSILLLLMLATALADKWETTTEQKVMSLENVTLFIQAKQPIAERTIAHLYAERIAMPIFSIGKVPSYHPHQSKPRCLYTTKRYNRYDVYSVLINDFGHFPTGFQHRVIEHYIYKLEHILI